MRDESGKILIAGFDKEFRAPTEAERAALRNVPDVDDALRKEFAIAQTLDGSVSDSVLQPALNIRGIESGRVGAQAANSIPTEARASIDFRLVPNQTPESVKALVERHIEKQGYTIVRDLPDAATRMKFPKIARVNWGAGYPPARTSLELPLSKEIADIMTAAGHESVKLPTLGGSIPYTAHDKSTKECTAMFAKFVEASRIRTVREASTAEVPLGVGQGGATVRKLLPRTHLLAHAMCPAFV